MFYHERKMYQNIFGSTKKHFSSQFLMSNKDPIGRLTVMTIQFIASLQNEYEHLYGFDPISLHFLHETTINFRVSNFRH